MGLFVQTPLVDHQSAGGPTVVQVRGALLVSSLQTLRELGHFDRYLTLLSKEQHDTVLFTIASSWVPCEIALAHYRACDAMELTEQELDAVGMSIVGRIMGTFLATLLRGSKLVGANVRPLAALQNYHRLWDRLLLGGSCTVTQTGLKDATIESRGVPMFRYRYFRVAYVSLIRGAGQLLGNTLYARVRRSSDSALSLSISWV